VWEDYVTCVDCVSSESVDMNPFPVRKKQTAKKDAHRGLQKKQNTVSSFKVKVKVMLRPTVPLASPSWNKAPIWGLRPDHYFCWTVAGLWGALSVERTVLSFARV
jgi:hypothetical protein